MLEKTTVILDDDTEEFDAYTDNSRWNGALNVWMTESQLTNWMNSTPYDLRFMDLNGKRTAILYMEDPDHITAETIQTPDGELQAYSMNGFTFMRASDFE